MAGKTKQEQQLEILELNAAKFKADKDGKYSPSYWALIGKIKNLKKQLPIQKTQLEKGLEALDKSWDEYLSK